MVHKQKLLGIGLQVTALAGFGYLYYLQVHGGEGGSSLFTPLYRYWGAGDVENKAYNTRISPNIVKVSSPVQSLDSSKAQKAISKIKDVSFKLQTPCSWGTGWALDYELPTGNKSYPTRWFIATNAHVINYYMFSGNPYKQVLPMKGRWKIDVGNYYSENECYRSLREGKAHLTIHKETEDQQTLYSHSLSDVKLFYVATDFLGTGRGGINKFWKRNYYYKDFAVLEVNFTDENHAKAITGDLYNKLKNDSSSGVNFFSKKELTLEKSGDELARGDENFFIGGYPEFSAENNRWIMNSNYNAQTNRASKLTYWNYSQLQDVNLKNKYGEPIIGHVDVMKIDRTQPNNTATEWNGVRYYNWGYNYILDNIQLEGGSSGSLATDIDGNVLGLYRMHDQYNRLGFVEPIRSKGIFENGQMVYPKYDLIRGEEGQVSSYKQQLDLYYPNIQTRLRSEKNWQ